MSGQWEVVGKTKKDKTSIKKPIRNDNNKSAPTPKVEDILPLSQVKNIYTNMGKNNKENKKPLEKDNKPKNDGKKPPTKKPEKKAEPPKTKPAKSIESALNMIKPDDIQGFYIFSKARLSHVPSIWFKKIAIFLNTRINVELNDPLFMSKPDHYPMSIVPSGIKKIMETVLNDVGDFSRDVLFDDMLAAMAEEMSKGPGHPALGHKLLLQFLAQNSPKSTVGNSEKHQLLATFQNRAVIGQSILWGLGQGGFKDFDVGIQVFKEFMAPLLETKNYSRFVIKYLSQLLKKHENTSISKDNFIFLFDFVNLNRNLPKTEKQELSNINKKLKEMMFLEKSSPKKYGEFFEEFLNKNLNSAATNTQKEIVDVLFNCLNKDQNCYKTWKILYENNYEQSYILLKYIGDHWRRLNIQLDKKQFKILLNSFLTANSELQAKNKEAEILTKIDYLCKTLLEKMVVSKSFPWKFFTFLIFLATASLLIYDVNKHGGWKKTQSVQTLKQIGVWEYGEKAWDGANQGLNWTKQRIEEYAPGYLDATGEYVAPYVELTKDLGKIAYNTGEKVAIGVRDKIPVVLEMIEKQVPGLLEQIEKSWIIFTNAIVDYSIKGYNYLTTEVFVGQLSPENMQKVVLTSLDSAQKVAVDYFNWAYNKLHATVAGE